MKTASSVLGLGGDDLDDIIDGVGNRWERLRGQRVLLTGGTGFIGKWLLASFLHANRKFGLGATIVVPSRRPRAFEIEFPEVPGFSDLHLVQGDVRELNAGVIGECQFAIHAATDVVAASTPAEIFDTCVKGTQRVLEVMPESCRLLLLSSGAVYGGTHSELNGIPEDWSGAPNPLDPGSAYGEGKRVSEFLCAVAAATRPGLEISIARCFALVGPHLPLDKHFAIGNFIHAAMHGRDIHVQGDGTPLRSYLYAGDLARWLWVMLFDAPNRRAYNVGAAESLSIGELAHRVNRILGGASEVRIAKISPAGVPRQAYVPAIDRIVAELGLMPRVSLDDAILQTARWATSKRSN